MFKPGALVPVQLRDTIFSRWDYETPDELSEVLRPDYFRAAWDRLRDSDFIDIIARQDGEIVLCEVAVIAHQHPDIILGPRPKRAKPPRVETPTLEKAA